MKDIFEHTILCKHCNKAMKNSLVSKNGFNLRALQCKSCNEVIIHPSDKQEYEEFVRLKQKDYEVKMRMVGNSYAVSIPREIVDFMKEQENIMNDMVKLSFEEAGRISLMFDTPSRQDSHVVSAREVKVIKNGKEVLHARKFTDSKHPERNKTLIKHDNEEIEEEQ